MLKFLKDNSYSAVKMLVNQIAMAMFGMMVSFAVATMDDWIWIAGTAVSYTHLDVYKRQIPKETETDMPTIL